MYLRTWQSGRQAMEVAAAPVEFATQQSPRLTLNIFCLISMLVTHILTVRYPLSFTPSLSLSFFLFFLIYFRIYLYIFACPVTFYLPLSHSHFVQVISGTLLIQFWTLSLSLWYALLGRQNVGREGGEPLEHFLSSNFPGKAIITRLRYTLPAHATWHRIVSHRIRNANAEPRDGRLWKLPAAYLFLKFMILKLLPQEARSKEGNAPTLSDATRQLRRGGRNNNVTSEIFPS